MPCLRLLAFAVCALAFLPLCAVAADAPAATAPAVAISQLPRGVRPVHYDVAVAPDAQARRFTGEVTVTIEVLEATTRLTLNAVDLTFGSVQLAPADGGQSVAALSTRIDAAAQTATFVFGRPLQPGTYRLAMAYRGAIRSQADGLFAIDYNTAQGRRRALFTQFENSDARRFMPCWDEPAYKATFTLTATVPNGQMAVSNMPIETETAVDASTRRVRFAPSPRMSSYLLFFALGDFERATRREGPTELGVVTRRGALAQAQFALDSAQIVLREYNDYFGIPYPLPKLDNVASPGGSRFFGAMENWGAIYTFERSLLLDPAIATQRDRERIFEVAAHEMAHQWFGNLVTMRWWDDLWLNEGFASWMEARTTARLHPEWNAPLRVMAARTRGMEADALRPTHAIVQRVETVDQVSQAFDGITYSKGAAVIRMLEAYVGADVWRDGVRRYMKTHAYGNTDTDDLWRAVEAGAGTPIGAIARDFTLQPGIPLLRVARSTCTDGRTTLDLEQLEFSADRPEKAPLRWRVPVIARVPGGDSARTVVASGKATLVVPGCGTVVVNAGQSGYYRTLYPPAERAALKDGFARLDVIDQLGFLDDLWALGTAGLVPLTDAVDVIARTPADAASQLWVAIAERLRALDQVYGDDAARRTAWRAFAIARLAPILGRVGWQAGANEAVDVAKLRGQLIETLGALGDPATIAEARRRYAARRGDPAAMPAALRTAILGVVVRHADAATWEALRDAAKAETTPLIKDLRYRQLSEVADATLATRSLALALTDEPGATNGATMIATVAEEHPDLAFDFATAHRAQIDKLLPATGSERYYPRLAQNSLDPAMVGKIKAFADAHMAPESRRAAELAMANVGHRIAIRGERLPAVDSWLKRQPG
jgi:aminopeptidase N